MARHSNFAARLGEWSAQHRKTAVFGWLVLVVLVTVIGGMAGQKNLTQADYGTGESGRAARILNDAGIKDPVNELVLVHSDTLTSDSADFRGAVQAAVQAVNGTGLVEDLHDPYTTQAFSADKHSALITFSVTGDPDTVADRIDPLIAAVKDTAKAHPQVTLGEFGGATALKGIDDSLGDDFARAELTALPVALGILLVVFGAFVAAVLPVALAVTACIGALGLLSLSSQLVPVDGMTNSVMFLMGLAVGVDYCLFYLRREREERALGRDKADALRIAAHTSGHSVLVSGLTVMVAMAGMFLSGLTVFEGFAVATIEVVAVAVVGSMTVLPALMAMLGDKVAAGRIPWISKRRQAAALNNKPANALLRGVLARPGVFAALAAAVLLVLAAPALGMKTEKLGMDKLLPSDDPLVAVSKQIDREFPGSPSPAFVVVKADDISSPQLTKGIDAFKQAALASGKTGNQIDVRYWKDKNIAQISVPLAGNGTDATSKAALATLRETIVPQTLKSVPGTTALVAGDLAFSVDYNDQLDSSIVPVFAFVMGVTFLLMLFSFRSLAISITSILLNLLSVAAAYGVMTAVFQHGWGASLVGTEAPGAIESWMPLFVFVVLFGLSMDYHVFVVSRIREAHLEGASSREAVGQGIRNTAGVVTSAGLIMVAVFAVFGTLGMQDFKQLGIGLAVAVLLDATIVRAVLLPAVMALLGDRNWYLPRWLGGGRTQAAHAHRPVPQGASAGSSGDRHETAGTAYAG
ncbi:MMPL family transporter [Kitasatospora sp. NPDC097643]|uniref:MMPL family transporter n=1 Tax=Kitasatospora sp. NPDC097643 TaxID=3157230 RepID=UPI003317679D